MSCLCGAISLCVGASTIITLETVHPGCIQRKREPCVNMLGCFMKNLMWLLVDITNLLSLLGVCISVSLMSCSLIVGASTIITFEKVHPGCVQRQREPFGCCMKNLMWFLLDITNLLSLLGVVCLYVLMSCSMIVCLPAALCLLRFVTCILSLIDGWLTKFFVLGSAKEPNRWYPAIPRAIQRKAHIRERRDKNMPHVFWRDA